MLRNISVVALFAAFVLGLAGCGGSNTGVPCPPPAPLPEGESAVRLKVVRGDAGGALALAEVHINDQGPFTFIVDTGASHTTIEKSVARRLNLPRAEGQFETTGIRSTSTSDPVRLENWRLGTIPMPAVTAAEVDMPDVKRKYQLDGLLGSDVLSQFGSVQIDFEGQLMILRPKPGQAK
jgi:predicted aspartyl protease